MKVIQEIILKAIREVTIFAKEDEEEFLKTVYKLSDKKQKETLKNNKEKLKIATARNEELNILITKLYEDYALKKITEKHFDRLFKKYDEEQSDTENKMKIHKKEIDDYIQSKTDTGKFLRMIKKYTDFET